jgi:putative ABC transport system permease protein
VIGAGKLDLTSALKDGSQGAGGGKSGHWLRSILVIAEIAVTLVLSFSCSLLLHSLSLAKTANPGFRPDGVLALELQLPAMRYANDDAVRVFYQRLMENLRHKPGVKSVGAANCPPPTGGCAKGWYSIPDMPSPAPANVPLALLTKVDPEYFQTLGMTLLAGRAFSDADARAGMPVVVVNQKLARQWWPTAPQRAVDRAIKFGGPYLEGPTLRIVGVVDNVRQARLDQEPSAEIYVPFSQGPSPAMVVMIRAAGDPARLIPLVRRAVGSIDGNVAIQSLQPFDLWLGGTLDSRRFSTMLMETFAALALLLSSVGIYGVLNHWVKTREKEIAIRQALGAARAEIVRWAAWHAMRLVVLGSLLGVLGGWASSHLLNSAVFGIPVRNPAIMLEALGAVVTVAVLAVCVPIWRATRIDAIRNLRDA